jgi:UDP-glucose 4-epimerase
MRESLTDPMTDAKVNVLGVLNVMNTATRYDVPNFIFASTGGALYGDTDQLPTPETVPPQPLSPYGITKMAGERYGYFFANSYDRNVTVLRYSNIYGPRLGRKAGVSSAVYRFLTAFENDERIEIRGDGEQSRDFVYVKDVARANRIALEQADGFSTYNVGSGTETSVNTLIETIASIYDTSAQPSYTPAIEGEVSRSALDVTKINRELGWEPTVSLQEGLQQTSGELY